MPITKNQVTKSTDKLAVDLKLKAQVDFTFLYLGARTIWKQITKATLVSICIERACSGKAAILQSDTGYSYTFEEIRNIGEQTVRDKFAELLKEWDYRFLKKMEEYNIPDDFTDDAQRDLARKIIAPLATGEIILRNTDIENILKIILISENDLSAYKGGGMYSFLKWDEEYTVYSEMKKILTRYRKLSRAKAFYTKVFKLLDKVLENATTALGYSYQKQEHAAISDITEENLAFYQKFGEYIADFKLDDYMSEEASKEFRKLYSNHLEVHNSGLEYMKNCGAGCIECILIFRKCADEWLKIYFKKIMRQLCFSDETLAAGMTERATTLEYKMLTEKGLYVFEKVNLD